MTQARVAIIKDGLVADVQIVTVPWVPPVGVIAVASDIANLGDSYDGTNFIPPAPDTSPKGLLDVANKLLTKHLREARLFDVGGVSVLSDAQSATLADLANLARWGQANQTTKRDWIDNNGAHTALTGAQFVSLYGAVGDYQLNLYAVFSSLQSGIQATPPTVTTMQQVVAAFS